MSGPQEWEGDLLQRRHAANFLYRVIRSKVDAQKTNKQDGALCIAVDGDWGVGKTFFVERWTAELSHMTHPVVRFDAWKNDLADDPLIAFISAIKESLKPWIASLPIGPQAKRAISRKAATVFKQAAKAALPLAFSIAANVGTRYAGEASIDLIKDALDLDEPSEEEGKKTTLSAKDSEKALQKFFDAALKQHQGKQIAINQLVLELEALVDHMDKQSNVQTPFFIFIDELDRCRPDYAIRLLEGMKHLFNAKGVCFVVTTNLSQLSEAIKVVYGGNFNGYGYLKRFFDFEYQLPLPEGLQYANYLLINSPLNSVKKLETGIHIRTNQYNSAAVSLPVCFDYVARLFGLSLRSQKQIVAQAEAAATALPSDATVHIFYLFCLTAIAHQNPSVIDAVISKKPDAMRATMEPLPNLPFSYVGNDPRGGLYEKHFDAKSLFRQYYEWSLQKHGALVNDSDIRSGTYPGLLMHSLLNEKLNSYNDTSLGVYIRCVRMAGQIFKEQP